MSQVIHEVAQKGGAVEQVSKVKPEGILLGAKLGRPFGKYGARLVSLAHGLAFFRESGKCRKRDGLLRGQINE